MIPLVMTGGFGFSKQAGKLFFPYDNKRGIMLEDVPICLVDPHTGVAEEAYLLSEIRS